MRATRHPGWSSGASCSGSVEPTRIGIRFAVWRTSFSATLEKTAIVPASSPALWRAVAGQSSGMRTSRPKRSGGACSSPNWTALAPVIVLWSRASVASSWVTDEAERGRAKLISVRIDDVPMPLGFNQLQAVDLVNWRGGRHAEVDRLISAVSETLKAPPPRAPVVPAPPHRKWYAAAAIALAVAVAATYPVVQWMTAPPPIMNQEIVLDASAGMAAAFNDRPSKLSAAVDALRVRSLHPKENLALRVFGGECGQDDESKVLVSFGTARRNRILKAAADLQPHGKPTLASAVISAMSDLRPFANTKRVVVLTGHADTCNEEAVRDIKERSTPTRRPGRRSPWKCDSSDSRSPRPTRRRSNR